MKAPYAVYVTKIGGPEVLQAQAIEMPVAKPNEVVIAHTAIAVNFVDVYLIII
jgi:NADPH2:quinone reductase